MPIPDAAGSFVGRRRELSALRAQLRTARLVTLSGPGGVGKTRLAIQLLASLEPTVAWVDLAPLHTVVEVDDAVRSAISASTKVVVLDNADQVIDAAAGAATRLLASDPSVRVIATSRMPLAIAGEAVWTVPGMRLPEQAWLNNTAHCLRADAFRLFVERARSIDPGFEPDPAGARTVAAICANVGGLPLGIELAAARLRREVLSDVAASLSALLGTGAERDRHASLASAIDWSHRLLDQHEATLLRRLAVYADSFSADAAHSVSDEASSDATRAVLARLVDRSFVIVDSRAQRYRLLVPIRAFAGERLDAAGEREVASARAAAYLVALLTDAPSRPVKDPGSFLRAEYNNVAALMPWLVERDAGALLEVLFGYTLLFWTAIPVHISVVREWLERAVARYPSHDTTRARALSGLARLTCELQGGLARARAAADEAVAIARSTGDRTTLAVCLRASSSVAVEERDYHRAIRELDEAVPLLEAAGSETLAMALSVRLVMKEITGDRAGSDRDLEQARALWAGLEPARRSLSYLTTICAADVAMRRGLPQDAEQLVDESVAICAASGAMRPAPFVHLAELMALRGRDERALRLAGIAQRLRDESGTWPSSFFVLSSGTALADARRRLGHRAPRLLQEGRALDDALAFAYALGERSAVLSERERTVVECIASGLSDREIAQRLAISIRTAERHARHVREKLGLRTRAQVAYWYGQSRSAE